ncbi:MAG: MscL family protein, partial [Rhodococcus sp.]
MLKGFKDFLLRGNVVDLAVAVVVGAAFTAIVTAFTTNIINPLVAAVGGSNELGWGIKILSSNDATFINIGAVITAIINF